MPVIFEGSRKRDTYSNHLTRVTFYGFLRIGDFPMVAWS